jgi:hypothetical protein
MDWRPIPWRYSIPHWRGLGKRLTRHRVVASSKGFHDENGAIGRKNDEPQGSSSTGEEGHGRRPPRQYL